MAEPRTESGEKLEIVFEGFQDPLVGFQDPLVGLVSFQDPLVGSDIDGKKAHAAVRQAAKDRLILSTRGPEGAVDISFPEPVEGLDGLEQGQAVIVLHSAEEGRLTLARG